MSVVNKLVLAIIVVASFVSGSVKELLAISSSSVPGTTEESKSDGGATVH